MSSWECDIALSLQLGLFSELSNMLVVVITKLEPQNPQIQVRHMFLCPTMIEISEDASVEVCQ